ncbi:MAG: isoprenylcysteine carboxylmethyltransferase family protein [Bacteroidetes bacterium]|nr:isoprenylcysteine carboxylmethyltransferase family protein [Bacteroidota bacterium]
MDPINIIVGLNIIATFGANVGGAKKGVRSSIIASKEKPKTYLQTLPLILSTLTLVVLIISIFQVGTFSYKNFPDNIRIIGLAIYVFFSWLQIWSYKSLGESYSQEILIFKNHKLIMKGPFKFIRHPQYLSQILADAGGAIATLSYILIPLIIIEIPFLILRARLEEKLLEKNFKEMFLSYKKKTGFMIPFVG